MWRQINIPYITERIIGFSLPVQDKIIVFSNDEMFLIDIVSPYSARKIGNADSVISAYYELRGQPSGQKQFIDWDEKKYQVFGLMGGKPFLSDYKI